MTKENIDAHISAHTLNNYAQEYVFIFSWTADDDGLSIAFSVTVIYFWPLHQRVKYLD